ncbi:MAG: hypothetical protein OXF76_01970 [Caldilineaceae bacterium]|nr:hypothetical protein [Caldilineaceae bacterium]
MLAGACKNGSGALDASSLSAAATTPDAHHSYLPWVEMRGFRSALARATPPPPDPTATPVPTDTPVPTNTPTPTVTPFPPGPPSKLGLFITRNHPSVFNLLRTGGVAVVKTLELDFNFARQIKEAAPRVKLIGRIDLPQLQLNNLNARAAAQDYANRLWPLADHPERRRHFDGWEAYNEPVAGNADEFKRLAEFEAERTRLLAQAGLRSVIGNFGTGQPPLEMWPHFLPAVAEAQAHGGWLGLHEYSAPTIYYNTTRDGRGRYPGVGPHDTGWLTLRYRQVYNQFLIPAGRAIPLVMTELGVDGLVTNRPGPANALGWQHFQEYWAQHGFGSWGPGAYAEQLVWYDQAMQQDSYVLGGCIFSLAGSPGWESYEIGGLVESVLHQYFSVHPQR